ncbi:MAG: hypothetical protein WB439_01515 [Acidobacteriaceae bacterium]
MRAAPAKDKKTIVVISIFVVLLLVFLGYGYYSFFGGAANPAAVSAPTPVSEPVVARSNNGGVETERGSSGGGNGRSGLGAAPGVAAKKMASTSASMDPTLDESAMLRTESLVYSGTGRNIFSAISAPPPMAIPRNVPGARPGGLKNMPPPMPVGPPPPPPIELKFFGTAVRVSGLRQAFLLQGEDVYLASKGDIVARKYKILNINPTNIQVEDLVNNDTQVLPLITR